MQKSNSPNIDLHIIQHQIFISKIEEFKIAYSYKNVLLLDQMIIFMRKWFLMHISEVDGKYVESSKKYLADKELNKN
jgi:hemerythrin